MRRCRVSYGSGVSEAIEKLKPDYIIGSIPWLKNMAAS
jgi:hypothetical protein